MEAATRGRRDSFSVQISEMGTGELPRTSGVMEEGDGYHLLGAQAQDKIDLSSKRISFSHRKWFTHDDTKNSPEAKYA